MPHPRIRKVEEIVPGWFGHTLRVTSPEELDEEVLGWLRESYQQMGMQERLANRKGVRPADQYRRGDDARSFPPGAVPTPARGDLPRRAGPSR